VESGAVQNSLPCENAAHKQTMPAIKYKQLNACSSPFFSKNAWKPGEELACSCSQK
jgi:hypothetical protein